MKIFDATAVIAFLSEMQFPEAFGLLSKNYKLVIPEGVANEITKEPEKSDLSKLRKGKVVTIVKVDSKLATQIQNSHPQLHSGECEAIACSITNNEKKNCIVSDDSKARKLYGNLNFKWTERLLDIMREKGLIDDKTYKVKTKKLQESPFYSSEKQ